MSDVALVNSVIPPGSIRSEQSVRENPEEAQHIPQIAQTQTTLDCYYSVTGQNVTSPERDSPVTD